MKSELQEMAKPVLWQSRNPRCRPADLFTVLTYTTLEWQQGKRKRQNSGDWKILTSRKEGQRTTGSRHVYGEEEKKVGGQRKMCQ